MYPYFLSVAVVEFGTHTLCYMVIGVKPIMECLWSGETFVL